MRPIRPAATPRGLFFSVAPAPQRRARKRKPQMKPPVFPAMMARPPVKFENTGTPTAPRSMYMPVAAVPSLAPRTAPVNAMAKVWSVMGTPEGMGMAIWASTAMTAANMPVMTMVFVVNFLSIFLFSLSGNFSLVFRKSRNRLSSGYGESLSLFFAIVNQIFHMVDNRFYSREQRAK